MVTILDMYSYAIKEFSFFFESVQFKLSLWYF